jgi:hypothetical protein
MPAAKTTILFKSLSGHPILNAEVGNLAMIDINLKRLTRAQRDGKVM